MRSMRVTSSLARRCLLRASVHRGLATLPGGEALANLAAANPHKEAIRYDHKNVKWTYKLMNENAEALASGILGSGLSPGDKLLSWLPLHFMEQHVLQFACSKAGLILYHLDPSQAITNPEGAKDALAKALTETEANMLITQEAGDDVNYVGLVLEVIPECRIFDFAENMPFISPRFPHLRYPVHTGLDSDMPKRGFFPLHEFVVPDKALTEKLEGAVITAKTPLMGDVSTGKTLTNEEVEKTDAWPVYNKMLKREYQDIEGVGVIF